MTKKAAIKPANEPTTSTAVTASSSNTVHQSFSPQKQQEQAILLEPFYERLIGMTFDQSATAIECCRDLCAEYGFTVKQEASTHRNIYVYCSREGLPDSLRNPKSNPQRKRPSKRCDCRWRVVLYENEKNQWEFRKSLNPEAGKHNHELMRPEEIERSWPKEVTDLICELARLRMTTQDIRARVRDQFPNIHWNERRFYNRLSEERQKIKLRDSVDRTHQLNDLWSKVCMATAGNDDLFQFVKQELIMLFQSICETVQIDPETFPTPLLLSKDLIDKEDDDQSQTSDTLKRKQSKPIDTAPKGYLSVEMPKQMFYIKIHNQRQLNETQLLKKRPRTLSEDGVSFMEPLRKQIRKGKGKLQDSTPLLPSVDTDVIHMSPSSSISVPITPPPPLSRRPPQQRQQLHQLPPQSSNASFVYSYDNSMALETTLSSYVNPTFQSNYTISSNPSTPGFNGPDMSFTFDPQQHSPIGRNSVESSNGNSNNQGNEPTIHPALHSNPMSHQQQQQQQQQHQRGGSITPPIVRHNQQQSQSSQHHHYQHQQQHHQGMFRLSSPSSANTHHNNNIMPLYHQTDNRMNNVRQQQQQQQNPPQ